MASITGTSNNDVLSGTADDDLIEGLAGDDTLNGDAGTDRYRIPPVDTLSTTRVSTAVDDAQGDGYSGTPSLSADGRYVAFVSAASNLIAGDSNDTWDVFVKDLQTGTITRASTAAKGAQGNVYSENPSLSADGHYVAFVSAATNLVTGDTKGTSDVFVKDLQTGAVTRASTATKGAQGNGYSENPSLSADGRYVVFDSDASNLVSGDTNDTRDVFIKDLETGAITRLSAAPDGTQGDGSSFGPSVSADGRHVAFDSIATNLVPEDANGSTDIFVKDLKTGALTLVSTAADGTQANDWSGHASISADGRYVSFVSWASNLVSGDTNDAWDVFVKNLATGAVTRASAAADGTQANGWSYASHISADGRYVVFDSDASNLVPGDTNDARDIFLKDLQTGAITRVSTVTGGTQANDSSGMPTVSADGRHVAFASWATNLALGDTNSSGDIFVSEPGAPRAGSGNDTLIGGRGNDAIDGGGGYDTAVFSGAVASYHFGERGGDVTVSGPDGSDTLTNIEHLRFGDLSFSIADRVHFDPLFYLDGNPDVAAAAIDPFTHYQKQGWTEGRDPNPNVHLAAIDGLAYIASYTDLMAAFGVNAAAGYQHFATTGLFEGRTTSFDSLEYIASYTDLVNAFHTQVAAAGNADVGAVHYILGGYAEHRTPDLFDAAQYLENYADLRAAFGSDTEAATLHYVISGYFEGRTDHHSL